MGAIIDLAGQRYGKLTVIKYAGRWATPRVQASNRRNNIRLVINGVSETLANLARLHGVNYETAKWRYKHGHSAEETLSKTPIYKRAEGSFLASYTNQVRW